jgi:hypothetical protein
MTRAGIFFKLFHFMLQVNTSLKTVVATLTYKIQKIKGSYVNRGNRRNHLYCNVFS